MSQGYEDRRNELCERFRQSLTSGAANTQYFDEDDLVEIFDFAGDLNDDYLRFEVLLCGARYYPDSVPLRERRALLYANYSDEVSSKFLSDNSASHGALWDITRLRNASPMGDEAIKSLDGLIETYSEFDDEEVIQLVDLASSLGQTDWLLNRLDALRAHVTFLPTLLFEIAVMLEMETRYDKAIKLLEELTELEPYNEQYWFMLAQEYDFNNNPDGALQALDLALAILPDDKNMRFYHARLLVRLDNEHDKAFAELKKLAKDYPEDINISRFLAALYIEDAPEDDDTARMAAASLLKNCFAHNPGNRQLASDLLAVDECPSDEIIAAVDINHAPADIAEWVEWASELSALGAYERAIDILLYCERKIGKNDVAINEALVIDYFMLEDFKMVCNRFELQTSGSSAATADSATLIFVAYAISLAKLGRTHEASEFSKMILKFIVEDGPDDINYALRRLGTGLVLTDIIERVKSHKPTDWSTYDPLGAWPKA